MSNASWPGSRPSVQHQNPKAASQTTDHTAHVRRHVVIVGGGFAGLAAALELERQRTAKDRYNVTMIDKQCYHTYHALLYEVATATETITEGQAAAIQQGVRIRLKALHNIVLKKDINVVQGTVTRINRAHRQIEFSDQPPMEYDQLILALGSVSHDFGIPGLQAHSLALKELPDALAIHQRLQELFDEFERRRRPVSVLVGGAGISGVETAGELRHYVVKRCRQRGHDHRSFTVTLLEGASSILPGFPTWAQSAVVRRLASLGVIVRTGQVITGVDAHSVRLKDGKRLGCDLLIWSGGIQAHPLMQTLDTPGAGNKRQVSVDPFLRLPDDPAVSVVGDSAFFIDPKTNRPVPQTAPVALAQGRLAAENIVRQLRGLPLQPHRPSHPGFVFPVGGRWAISTLWNVPLSGWLAWVIRKLVDLRYFLGILRFQQAVRVFWLGGRTYMEND